MIYWITGSYLLGSFAGYLIGRGRTQNTIEDVIDSLCEQGFLKHSQDPKTGEVEIKKWNSLDQLGVIVMEVLVFCLFFAVLTLGAIVFFIHDKIDNNQQKIWEATRLIKQANADIQDALSRNQEIMLRTMDVLKQFEDESEVLELVEDIEDEYDFDLRRLD